MTPEQREKKRAYDRAYQAKLRAKKAAEKPKPEPKPKEEPKESAMSRVMNNPDLLGKIKEFTAVKKRTPAERKRFAKKMGMDYYRRYIDDHPNLTLHEAYYEGYPSYYIYDANYTGVGLRGRKGLIKIVPGEALGGEEDLKKKLLAWVYKQPDWDEWVEKAIQRNTELTEQGRRAVEKYKKIQAMMAEKV